MPPIEIENNVQRYNYTMDFVTQSFTENAQRATEKNTLINRGIKKS
jgi:hypothetical protein